MLMPSQITPNLCSSIREPSPTCANTHETTTSTRIAQTQPCTSPEPRRKGTPRKNAPKHLTSGLLWCRVRAIYVGSTYTRHAMHESRGGEHSGSACSSAATSRVAITTNEQRRCRRRQCPHSRRFHQFHAYRRHKGHGPRT